MNVEPRTRTFSREPNIYPSVLPRSAGTSRAACGVPQPRPSSFIYVPGEGWIEWDEIVVQVKTGSRVFWLKRKVIRLIRTSASRHEIDEAATALRDALTQIAPVAAATKQPNHSENDSEPEHKTSLAA